MRTTSFLAPELVVGLGLLLGGACSHDASSAPPSSSTKTSTGSADFDASAMIDPGTKGLVVTNAAGRRATFYDFDRIAYGTRPVHVFLMRNDEGRDVAILDLLPSCGCTRATVRYTDAKGEVHVGAHSGSPALVVPAGAAFELECAIDTTVEVQPNMDKLAQVRMRTDSSLVPYLTFELHMIVERTFRAVPAVLDLGRIPQGGGKSARTDVSTAVKGATARVVGLGGLDGPFTASVDASELGGERFWVVIVNAPSNLPLGPVRGALHLDTTGNDGTGKGGPLEIPVTGTVVQDIAPEPSMFAFGAFSVGEPKQAAIELTALVPGERFAFLGAEVRGTNADKLKLERTPHEPDEQGRATQWTIALTAPSDVAFGAFSGTVDIKTDHPRMPVVRVAYGGNAK
jgi:hypothetical protein